MQLNRIVKTMYVKEGQQCDKIAVKKRTDLLLPRDQDPFVKYEISFLLFNVTCYIIY